MHIVVELSNAKLMHWSCEWKSYRVRVALNDASMHVSTGRVEIIMLMNFNIILLSNFHNFAHYAHIFYLFFQNYAWFNAHGITNSKYIANYYNYKLSDFLQQIPNLAIFLPQNDCGFNF